MCKVTIYHNWCKCGKLESIDSNEYGCNERNQPSHMVKEVTYEVRNVPEECEECIKLREEEEEKREKEEKRRKAREP